MQVVTNGVFAVGIIPECCATGLRNWASINQLELRETTDSTLDYYIPYRSSYQRIIRGIAADLHEILLQKNIVDLATTTWAESKPIAEKFIIDYLTEIQFPILKDFWHSAPYGVYHRNVSGVFFNVDTINNLPAILNKKYNLNLTTTIPTLPNNFYEHTVPYWYIDEIFKSNYKFNRKLKNYCRFDEQQNKDLVIIDLQ